MPREQQPDLVVLDASFVLRYVLHDRSPRPHPEAFQALRSAELVVPPLWNSEIANALVQAERRGSATPARVGQALAAINALVPIVDNHLVDVTRNLEIARAYGVSAYDALYLELALRRRAALATYDEGLIAAAPSAGIRLYPPPAG
jgi:predicted nucleic acid-binding protein